MSFQVDSIVPWGRSLEEYERMFALSTADVPRRILGCGDGPASFNQEWTARGGNVVSCDPLYEYSKLQIAARFEAIYPQMLAELHKNEADFVWDFIASADDLGRRRRAATELFLRDYDQGRHQGRYVSCALPHLPFADNSFDLALSSHFLFLYSEHLSLEFHRRSVYEMLRLAPEVRIFPLLQVGGAPSSHVEPITNELQQREYSVEFVKVDYEFQRGGHTMLRIRRS